MAENRVLTLPQVAQHKSKKDCWLVIDGRVVNVTKFLEEHPGGEDVLIELAGKDATKEFKAIGHSKAAQKLVLEYQVGILSGYTSTDEHSNGVSIKKSSTYEEMSASIIKDSEMPKHAAFIEFFVPLSVAVSYFVYSYLT